MNKKFRAVALTAGIISTTLIPQNAYAHGFLKSPVADPLYVVQLMVPNVN